MRLMRQEEGMLLHPDFDYWNPSLNLARDDAALLSRVKPATVCSHRQTNIRLTDQIVITGVSRFSCGKRGLQYRAAPDSICETVAG